MPIYFIDDVLEINDQSCCIISGPLRLTEAINHPGVHFTF